MALGTVAGLVGMLVGARLDFGALGLAALADLCSATLPTLADTFRYRVSVAPWTHAGMFLGCGAAMVLAARRAGTAGAAGSAATLHLVTCSAGMLAGMAAADALVPAAGLLEASPVTRMLMLSGFGMAAGMGIGWYLAEASLSAWRSVARDAALPEAGLPVTIAVEVNPGVRSLRLRCDGER